MLNRKGRVNLTETHKQWGEPMLCTDTALLYIPKASSTSCAKLCFGLRPSQLPFGLYQLSGLPFCKKLLNYWSFQKQVKADFQKRPIILLWTEQCYYTVLIRIDKKGWERMYFHGTWLYDFVLKLLVSLYLFHDTLWSMKLWFRPLHSILIICDRWNSKASEGTSTWNLGGVSLYKYRLYILFFRDIDLGALYIAFSTTVASRLLQATCLWKCLLNSGHLILSSLKKNCYWSLWIVLLFLNLSKVIARLTGKVSCLSIVTQKLFHGLFF